MEFRCSGFYTFEFGLLDFFGDVLPGVWGLWVLTLGLIFWRLELPGV